MAARKCWTRRRRRAPSPPNSESLTEPVTRKSLSSVTSGSRSLSSVTSESLSSVTRIPDPAVIGVAVPAAWPARRGAARFDRRRSGLTSDRGPGPQRPARRRAAVTGLTACDSWFDSHWSNCSAWARGPRAAAIDPPQRHPAPRSSAAGAGCGMEGCRPAHERGCRGAPGRDLFVCPPAALRAGAARPQLFSWQDVFRAGKRSGQLGVQVGPARARRPKRGRPERRRAAGRATGESLDRPAAVCRRGKRRAFTRLRTHTRTRARARARLSSAPGSAYSTGLKPSASAKPAEGQAAGGVPGGCMAEAAPPLRQRGAGYVYGRPRRIGLQKGAGAEKEVLDGEGN